MDDPRNELLLVAGEIAVRLAPTVFIAENVTGVTAGLHKQYWDGLESKLRTAGYKTAQVRCEGTRMGIAQTRTRMVLLAWNNGKDLDLIMPTRPGGVLRHVLGEIDGAPNHVIRKLLPGSDLHKIALRIKPGQKLSNVRGGPRAVHTWLIPEVFGRTTRQERDVLGAVLRLRRRRRIRDWGDADPIPGDVLVKELGDAVLGILDSLERKRFVRRRDRLYDLTHSFNGKFRRLDWDSPAPTVDTRFGNPRYFLHPEEQRGFTVREAARIQGFPDSFVFHGSERTQFRLVGNAVPPPVAQTLAVFVKEALLS